MSSAVPAPVQAFIGYWSQASGGERGNFQKFALELTALLGVSQPEGLKADETQNDYVFEKKVAFRDAGTVGFIDLYKRGCFVLEAKQSRQRSEQSPLQAALALEGGAGTRRPSGVHRDAPGWDQFMRAARIQAESYARALPPDHGWPPFIVIVDVGHVIELYADFTGQGKHYAQFPDRQSYRIPLGDLAKSDIRERLRAVWTDPRSLDPARRTAEVTREIAALLAELSKQLERRLGNALSKDLTAQDRRHHESLIAGKVATFLMRCLFTMFAEDVKLIREDSFLNLLRDYKDDSAHVHIALEQLWRQMDEGGFSPLLRQDLMKFNGKLFKNAEAIPLNGEELNLLIVAAGRSWGNVEPAIFGTLLERALDPTERHRLGAHYTPRAYVERLVIPTIIEPLTDDWLQVQAIVTEHLKTSDREKAVQAVAAFHAKLCATRVLDPACGTGNFLYVAMELMKRLEGEVLDALQQLGEDQYLLELDRHTVDPHQFLGLEINPRAVEIAELVLWIGYLQWHFRTRGRTMPAEPVLKDFHNIVQMDAVLAYDRQDVLRGEHGRVMTRWDGVTTKLHPITGEEVPDPEAQAPIYSYVNPRPAKWPEADFIVGNPPFIGTKRLISSLGEGYAEALRDAHPLLPRSVDFVMYWWASAATLVAQRAVRRAGLITTNSITQSFNRKAVALALSDAKKPISIVFAIPDHPWVEAVDGAGVRIAMSVVGQGRKEGVLHLVSAERTLREGDAEVELDTRHGIIEPDFRIGTSTTSVVPLRSNGGVSGFGSAMHGQGFILDPATAMRLQRSGTSVIRPFLGGKDLLSRPRRRYVVDFSGLTELEARQANPDAFQHIADHVKPERDHNARKSIRELWWRFGWERPLLRKAIAPLRRYIGTTETAQVRVFQFIEKSIVPDHMIIAVASEDAAILGTLSSRFHTSWARQVGGTLVHAPRYNTKAVFDPFPFSSASEIKVGYIRALGEELDRFRKERLAQHAFLTMTGLYNVLSKLRGGGGQLTPKERVIHEAGLVSVLKQLHDDIDAAVADAYGWPRDLTDEQILERLVALNRERAAEEAEGLVRWLRPDYQMARAGQRKPAEQAAELDLVAGAAKKPKFPTDLWDQIAAVRTALAAEGAPADAVALARRFAQGARIRPRIEDLLRTLAAIGQARPDGTRWFAPR